MLNEYRFGLHARDVDAVIASAPPVALHPDVQISPTEQCLACVDNRRDCVLLPCAHLALCNDCVASLAVRSCPICRCDIESTLRVFHA